MKQQLINAPKHLIPPFLLTTEHSTPRKGIFTCRQRRKTADNFVARELDIEQISLLLAGEEYFGLYQVQKDNGTDCNTGQPVIPLNDNLMEFLSLLASLMEW
ncbi:hypothetical protein CEXT_676081 [Caerostris extrusa]|uniref:Uncharacterized protein n=1 Tax=Caerostris extrusa TaxID=172846 RepID=A0AAV4PUT2_CAEEX|nr:hypothetical protein CEXT_676081 [Caerostris extrusa]